MDMKSWFPDVAAGYKLFSVPLTKSQADIANAHAIHFSKSGKSDNDSEASEESTSDGDCGASGKLSKVRRGKKIRKSRQVRKKKAPKRKPLLRGGGDWPLPGSHFGCNSSSAPNGAPVSVKSMQLVSASANLSNFSRTRIRLLSIMARVRGFVGSGGEGSDESSVADSASFNSDCTCPAVGLPPEFNLPLAKHPLEIVIPQLTQDWSIRTVEAEPIERHGSTKKSFRKSKSLRSTKSRKGREAASSVGMGQGRAQRTGRAPRVCHGQPFRFETRGVLSQWAT